VAKKTQAIYSSEREFGIMLRTHPSPVFWGSLLAVCALFAHAGAAIYLDEDFEGTSAFVDQDFPLKDYTTAPAAPLVQGINLRAYSSDATYTSPKVLLGTNQGSVVSTRAHSGTKCYELSGGQGLAVAPGQFSFRNSNWFRFWQFAVSTDAASAAQGQGTEIGRFEIDYANASTTSLTPDVTITVLFQANGSGGVDIVCTNTGVTLGTLSGASDDWRVVSVIAMNRVEYGTGLDLTLAWAAYDPLTDTDKGPPYSEPLVAGVYVFVDDGTNPVSLTRLTRADHLGLDWGNEDSQEAGHKIDTSEIGWRFTTTANGAIFLDDLYWDGGLHQELARGFDNEQAARMLPFANQYQPPRLPGIPSTIKKIFVVGHEHLDIGFDAPPETMRNWCKTHIDTQIDYARFRPDFKWNIEDTWAMQNWIDRSTPAEIDELMGMIRSGQFALGALHSTPHSGKLGVEQVNRLLWHATEYRHLYNIPVLTAFQDDVPGATWAYPQVLARSGINYLVAGCNMFIGGAFATPYDSYVFYWEGPDGSRVLTRVTKDAYPEGFTTYGLPYGSSGSIDRAEMEAGLKKLTDAGYPYDAVLVQNASDAKFGVSRAEYNAANTWNSTYDNPEIILATPDEFFEYMIDKYDSVIPVRRGNWTTTWDAAQVVEPISEEIVKQAQDNVTATEKMWSIASALGLGDYPFAEFDNAWEKMQVKDEHAGAGPCWPGYFTQAQVDAQNNQQWGYTVSLLNSATATQESAQEALLGNAADPADDSIVVFNPLSWTHTGLVRVKVDAGAFSQTFHLVDAVTQATVPHQMDSRTSEVLFVAPEVPSVGLKRFRVVYGQPSPGASSLTIGPRTLENSRFQVQLDTNGYISSLYDKTASREMIDTADAFDFNRAIVGKNQEWFLGMNRTVADPVAPIFSTAASGPVAATLRVENANHVMAGAEVTLYDDLDRIDITDTIDWSFAEYVPYTDNSVYYGHTFPFDLSSFTVRVDTAAGWLNPATDSFPGSFVANHVCQHGVALSEADYGVHIAIPDVYVTSFGAFRTPGASFAPTNPTLVTTVFRKFDESQLKGGSIGYVVVEDGIEQWDVRYSIASHTGEFDPVRESRFGWEVAVPMRGMWLDAASGAPIATPATSYFSVDADNVIITDIKNANFAPGLVVKLQEVTNTLPVTEVTLSSEALRFSRVTEVTPLEDDIQIIAETLPEQGLPPNAVMVTLGPGEIRCLRIEIATLPQAGVCAWMLY